MKKPYLLVVTGRPGSGKSTLAGRLGQYLSLPVVSRDGLKEGYVRTQGRPHDGLPASANKIVTDLFAEVVTQLLAGGVSLIAEAAFQHALWRPMLERYERMAQIHLLICRVDAQVALERSIERAKRDRGRAYFHGDGGEQLALRGAAPYEEPRFDAPTLGVDTSGAYRPSIEQLAREIFKGALPPID